MIGDDDRLGVINAGIKQFGAGMMQRLLIDDALRNGLKEVIMSIDQFTPEERKSLADSVQNLNSNRSMFK